MTRSAKVRRLLMEGPATRHEMKLQLHWDRFQTERVITQLWRHGHIKNAGRVDASDDNRFTFAVLYELTPQGRAWARQYPNGLPR